MSYPNTAREENIAFGEGAKKNKNGISDSRAVKRNEDICFFLKRNGKAIIAIYFV
jgi:hypothetical protein